MSVTDTLPVDYDYGAQVGRESNLPMLRAESARESWREKAAPQRIWGLVFNRRSLADWNLLYNFWRKLQHHQPDQAGPNTTFNNFFNFTDPESGRKYSVQFTAPPAMQHAGFETYDIRAEVMESIGVALATYPDFGGSYPSLNIPVGSATDLGGNGKMFVYAGYGYRVNGSFTTIYLDELVTGGENPKTDVVLGLHRVRIVGGSPSSLDYLI